MVDKNECKLQQFSSVLNENNRENQKELRAMTATYKTGQLRTYATPLCAYATTRVAYLLARKKETPIYSIHFLRCFKSVSFVMQ
jgi:hypothetical protein